MQTDTVIVGEVNAGEAAKVRKSLEKAIKQVNASTFDVAELLHKVKAGHLYTTPTFTDYIATLDMKVQRAQYLEHIADVMEVVGITRAEYEPIGVTKLRAITRLDPTATYTNPETKETFPMTDYIVGLVEVAPTKKAKELEGSVRVLLGETGENDMTWLNIRLLRLTKENIIDKALEKAAINIGSVATNADGSEKDASDGRKLEVICINYLNDTQSDPEIVK